MAEFLKSVGLDVGTTTTQMILSRLRIENSAGSFSVPEMKISEREILYKSKVYFTPLKSKDLVDAKALEHIVSTEYEKAGIRKSDVDTGAIIITGETGRKENAGAVLRQLSGFAGDFVVAAAGPDLESVLAAKGAGADDYSLSTGETVFHVDIGGGTSNTALIKDGEIIETGCLNVGGRLIKLDYAGKVRYVSPVLKGIYDIEEGELLTETKAFELGELLASVLEMAAGRRKAEDIYYRLITDKTVTNIPKEPVTVSFSGGVADCIEKDVPWLEYGDLGPVLGRAIRKSALCAGKYVLGKETIRATVIGAGCHSAQLSGSTVFYRNVRFPIKNLPVVRYSDDLKKEIRKFDENVIIALEGAETARYRDVIKLAEEILRNRPHGAIYVCAEKDIAKALGQALSIKAGAEREILCIDSVKPASESYMDIGEPIGPALPVVVKTLVLSK